MTDELRRQTQLYGTQAEWLANDLVLLQGEIGFVVNEVLNSVQAKVGNGFTVFSELPYLAVVESDGNVAVPSPTVADQLLVSVGPGGLAWGYLDGGTWTTPSKRQAILRREFVPGIVGPPMALDAGVLAVNLNGDLNSDNRPALYVGDHLNRPVRVVSQDDLLLALSVKSIAVNGGTNAADSLNLWPTPIDVDNNQLLIVSYDPYYYILNCGPGRYGAISFSGSGGPGSPITMSQLTLLGSVREIASSTEILLGTAPTKLVVANENLPGAILDVVVNKGVQFRPATGGAGVPVLTRSDGRIDVSLLPTFTAGLTYRGTFTPSVSAEYPTPVSTSDLFVIGGLGGGGYTLTTGGLVGTLLTNGDQLIWNGLVWAAIDIAGSANVVLADGSTAMTGTQAYGGHSIVSLGTISMASGRYTAALNGGTPNVEGIVFDAGTF